MKQVIRDTLGLMSEHPKSWAAIIALFVAIVALDIVYL